LGNADPLVLIIGIVVVILSLAIHEFAHAKFADMAGDPTPRMMGRVTLNPIAHLDPLGTVMIVLTMLSGFGIGWGKPVMVNPSKMHNPKWDHFVSVAAGPISNLVQAVIYGTLYRVMVTTGFDSPILETVCLLGTLVNVSLCLFNLIPLGPLDGHWLVGAFLPDRLRYEWYKFNATTGSFLLLGLVIFGQFMRGTPFDIIGGILRPAASFVINLILGTRLI